MRYINPRLIDWLIDWLVATYGCCLLVKEQAMIDFDSDDDTDINEDNDSDNWGSNS